MIEDLLQQRAGGLSTRGLELVVSTCMQDTASAALVRGRLGVIGQVPAVSTVLHCTSSCCCTCRQTVTAVSENEKTVLMLM